LLAYLKEHFGGVADLASVVGLLVSLVGFVATIIGVRKARRAAEEARQAAREVVLRIKSQLLSNEIEAAIRMIRQTDKACRERNWTDAADSCDEARSLLTKIPQDDRLHDDELVAVDAANSLIGQLLLLIPKLRSGPKDKGLPDAKAKDLHEVLTKLGRIHGRL